MMIDQPIPPAIAQIAPDGNLTPRQKRRLLIEMSLRKQKPGTGSSHAFMLRRTAMNPWPDLRQILKDFKWVIIGGVATRAYMPERATKDIDILVPRSDGHSVIESLKEAGYQVVTELAVPGFLLESPEGVELDILFADYEWLEEALATPQHDMADYPVLGLPYLVLMKMDTGRGRDFGDVTTMLGWANEEELNEVRRVIARYSAQDLNDLESLIFIGQQERQMPKS
ncbi:MAG: nucleotidyl transferase AbiEii/AbiGii toxin family protein [Anaerolineae bacterium]|nr:nucleotidyl transferase AbiEii/AbiGii toxin family protein [Anaerolineae bacterium]